jgi:hypothetical protein
MMALAFKYDESSLGKNLQALPGRVSGVLVMYAETIVPELQAKMQVNRPWFDRTGMAKATLRASVSTPRPEVVRITLSHGAEYGIWLELANEKRFAIIAPTIRMEAPRVIEGLQGIMSKIAG